ncbi:MAG: acyltransferase family protein [Oscillospiraceae bacterium]|nr:acyltransferase family protein [Oscillospiraceae bacterium]
MVCAQENRTCAPAQRDHAFDNIRGLLIFSVVLGHLLEICVPFLGSNYLYQLIYSFHMPAMIFLLGYFARFSLRKLLCSWLIPYVLLQVGYICFETYVLKKPTPLQFLTPHWILWFLAVGLYYQLLIPLYDRKTCLCKGLILGGSILLALAVGYVDAIGYSGGLSRFFVFQPFFLMGFYAARRPKGTVTARSRLLVALISLGAFLVCAVILYRIEPSNAMLFGAHPYSALGHNAGLRGFFLFMGLCMIVFLCYGCRTLLNRRLPLLTYLGQNTLSVFLLHGFALKLLGRYAPQLLRRPWGVLLCALGLLLLFGNPWVGKAVKFLCSDRWLPGAKKKRPAAKA